MPAYKNQKKTKQYSLEFKRSAVEMSLEDDVQVQEVAARLDIHPFMLSRWRKEYREGLLRPSRPPSKAVKLTVRKTKNAVTGKATESSELRKLKRENERLKKELDLVKKWQRFLAEKEKNDTGS
jgi:transposase